MEINGIYGNHFTAENLRDFGANFQIETSDFRKELTRAYSDTVARNKNVGIEDAHSNDSKEIDFTNCTFEEVRDWVNTRVINGEMTADESSFILFVNYKGRFNLMEKLQTELDSARYFNHEYNINRFEKALQHISKEQG